MAAMSKSRGKSLISRPATTLIGLTEASEIKEAYEIIWNQITHDSEPIEATIGYQGGKLARTVYWHAHLKMWATYGSDLAAGRHWFALGSQNPHNIHSLSIVCEVNAPLGGINRRTAGAFAHDSAGTIYITHNGKIGGGREGIGKTAFLESYRGSLESILWSDGQITDAIVIGAIDGPHLLAHLQSFMRQVDLFKASAIRGNPTPTTGALNASFTPEFAGVRESYVLDKTIEAQCDHGPVVLALHDELCARSYEPANDQQRDLFLQSPDGQMSILFEAKTDLSTSSVYEGLGQLLFHSALQLKPPRRVLVLPGVPKPSMLEPLSRLGITVLSYEWRGGRPVFPALDELFRTESVS